MNQQIQPLGQIQPQEQTQALMVQAQQEQIRALMVQAQWVSTVLIGLATAGFFLPRIIRAVKEE